MRVLTWNVAGRVARQSEQADAVKRVGADVVALQEVTARTVALWRAALADAGLGSCECALDDAPAEPGRRLLGVLTAAREPLRRLPPPSCVPWPAFTQNSDDSASRWRRPAASQRTQPSPRTNTGTSSSPIAAK